jgi:hypothetical protein
MTEWPECSVCKIKIEKGQPFVVVEHDPKLRVLVVAHEYCVKEPKPRVRLMNKARSWAVREYSTVRDSASASA